MKLYINHLRGSKLFEARQADKSAKIFNMIFGQSDAYTGAFAVLSSAGFLSNLFLLICMIKDPLHVFRNPSSYLIANLAIGDLESCAGQLIVQALSLIGHVDTATAAFNNGITFFGPDLSLMSLLALAVERHMCITRPILYRMNFTTSKIASLLALMWFLHISRIVAIIYCIPRGIIELKDVKKYTLSLYAVCVFFSFVGNISTLRHMKRNGTQSRALREGSGNESQATNTGRAQRKFVVTMVIVTSCMAVTIVPFTVLMFVSNIHAVSLPPAAIETVKITYFMNFVINPAMYFWRMSRYRKSIIAVLCWKKLSI